MALSPFVFIGIGGSGGKTLRVVHDVLSNALTTIGWDGEWPQAWQFLHIEVAANPDGIEPGLPFTLPLSDFQPLTTPGSTYRALDRRVSQTNRDGLDNYLAWNSWRPYPPENVPVTISLGAGQYRAVGRVAVLNGLEEVGNRVNLALSRAMSADTSELERIQELWGSEDLGAENVLRNPSVIVVASLSGGSGSGALLDVCDVVRSHRPSELTNVTAVVYAPEVFEDSQGDLEPGIAPNTFVALNELLNASWVRGAENLPLSREVHFGRSGVNPHRDRTGPDSVFLVGRRNANVTLGNTSEIYRVMGRSLADLALSESQQDSIGAYSAANAAARAAAVQHTVPIAPALRDVLTPTHTNMYALGFARLSVGREFFREYAAQRLAKEAVLRLREGHRSRRLPGDTRTDEVLAEDYASTLWPAFLRDSRLNEVGYTDNAVIEALLPPGELEDMLSTWTRSTRERVDLNSRNGQIPVEDARQQVRDEIEQAFGPEGLLPGFDAKLKERAILWRRGVDGAAGDTRGIHSILEDLVASTAARAGLIVTRLLLERLAGEVNRAVEDLETERRQRRLDGEDGLQALLTPKGNEPRQVETEAGGYVDVTVVQGEGYNVMYQLLYAEAVSMATTLMRELPAKLITPMLRAVNDAAGLLRQEVEPPNGRTSDFTLWPGTSGIPQHLTPSRVERTLDDVEDFPEVFVDLVQKSTGAGSALEGVSVAVEEVIAGKRLATQYAPPAPMTYRGRWVPEAEGLRRPNERASTAVIEMQMSLDALLSRARAWLLDSEKAVGRYVSQSMAEYLTDEDANAAQRSERRTRLTGEFRELLRLAQPLVKIDIDNLQLAHGVNRPDYELVMSPLNIPPQDHQLKAELEEVAQAVLGQQTSIVVGPQRSGTQVMTTLKQPIHPVALQSVMEPIYTQWNSDHLGQNFWSYRRARPLLEWVPMAPTSKQALAEGWVTARLLGWARTIQNLEDLSWHIEVRTAPASGGAGQWQRITATGPRAVTPDDALGCVFESVAMSSLEVYRTKSLESLAPFQALVDYGAVPWSRHRLASWLQSGTGIDSAGQPILTNAADVSERSDQLLQGLADMERAFLAHARMPTDSSLSVDDLQRLPRIEVARLAIAAVSAIRTKFQTAGALDHGGRV